MITHILLILMPLISVTSSANGEVVKHLKFFNCVGTDERIGDQSEFEIYVNRDIRAKIDEIASKYPQEIPSDLEPIATTGLVRMYLKTGKVESYSVYEYEKIIFDLASKKVMAQLSSDHDLELLGGGTQSVDTKIRGTNVRCTKYINGSPSPEEIANTYKVTGKGRVKARFGKSEIFACELASRDASQQAKDICFDNDQSTPINYKESDCKASWNIFTGTRAKILAAFECTTEMIE